MNYKSNEGYPGQFSGGQFLEFALRTKGMTVQELSDMSGVEQGRIRRILSGRLKLIPGYVEEIFKALDLNVVMLIEEEDDEGDFGEAEEGFGGEDWED